MSAARIEWIRVSEGNRVRALGLEIQWVGDPGARTGQRLSLSDMACRMTWWGSFWAKRFRLWSSDRTVWVE